MLEVATDQGSDTPKAPRKRPEALLLYSFQLAVDMTQTGFGHFWFR